MKYSFTLRPASRAEILAVACPTCGAEAGEACRRADGRSDALRLGRARAVRTQQRTALRDADKAKRVNMDFLRP